MINKEQLIEFGMEETSSPMYPLKKTLGENEDGSITLAISMSSNEPSLVLVTPDGQIHFTVESIEELKIIKKCITGYEPHY